MSLPRKPLAWFPGMAGTENQESAKLESVIKGKSVWDRFVAPALAVYLPAGVAKLLLECYIY